MGVDTDLRSAISGMLFRIEMSNSCSFYSNFYMSLNIENSSYQLSRGCVAGTSVLKSTYPEGLFVVRKCNIVYTIVPFLCLICRFGHVYIILHLESSFFFNCR